MQVTGTVEITPKMLAKAFWEMHSAQQVEFLKELALVTEEDSKENTGAYSLGQLQWYFVGTELEKEENHLAKEMMMSMSAPLYFHTLNHRYGG